MKDPVVNQNKQRSSRMRRCLLRQATAHNPSLVFNLEPFDLAGSWNQLLMSQQAQQFNR
jgi:hypothetical protein